jgi:holo-[acyl-carrier protein] synthase
MTHRILGLGLDLVDLDRMARLLERHGEAAVRRICRPQEVRIGSGPGRVAHLAGLFAAKEATMKALGTGWAAGVGFRQIEVVRRTGGAPALELHDAARERARELGARTLHLSITHDARTAAAVVILEGDGPATTR